MLGKTKWSVSILLRKRWQRRNLGERRRTRRVLTEHYYVLSIGPGAGIIVLNKTFKALLFIISDADKCYEGRFREGLSDEEVRK